MGWGWGLGAGGWLTCVGLGSGRIFLHPSAAARRLWGRSQKTPFGLALSVAPEAEFASAAVGGGLSGPDYTVDIVE